MQRYNNKFKCIFYLEIKKKLFAWFFQNVKCQHRRPVNVLLLNGRSMSIYCNSATATARQVLETVIKTENYVENYFLGLCAIIGGDFVFLPPNLKIYKVRFIIRNAQSV